MGHISSERQPLASFLYFQVRRPCITSRTSSNFGHIRSPTAELAALQRLQISALAYNWKMMSPLFLGGLWSDPIDMCM